MIVSQFVASELVDYLNDLLEHDRPAVAVLLSNRVPCNISMANHPTCEVLAQHGGFNVGLLGLLNGFCRKLSGEVSHGPIVAVFDGKAEEEHFDRLSHFRLATEEEKAR